MNQVAVFHAMGVQGHAIAEQVAAGGFTVRRLSGKAGPGLTQIDSADEEAIARALDGSVGAVFTVPQDYRAGAREAYAQRVVRAAERAGIRRLVVNIGGPIIAELDDPMTHELLGIRAILTGGAVETVILQPTSFLDNLTEPWSRALIVKDGVLSYPIPEAARISFISHRSLGDFAAAALRVPQAAGQVFDIGGPEALGPAALAEAVGEAAQQEVRFAEMPLQAFIGALDAAFGAPAGARVAALYAHYRADPDASRRDPADWAILDVEPESVAAWAGRQDWRIPVQA